MPRNPPISITARGLVTRALSSYHLHVQTPHRAVLALPLILIALALAGCSGGVVKPEGWASPVFDSGITYALQRKDSLTAIDEAGNVRWTFPDENKEAQKDIDLGSVYGTPQLVDGILYFATYDGDALAVRAESGDLVWRTEINDSTVGTVAVEGDLFAVGSTEGRLFVLNSKTGAPAPNWPQKGLDLGGPIWAPAIARDGTLFVATMRGVVRAYNFASAETRWSGDFKTDGAVADLALLGNGQLVVPSLDRHVYFLDRATGTESREAAELGDWAWGLPAISGNTMVLTDISGTVYGFDVSGGPQKWAYETGNRLKSSPAIVGDTVVVADREPIVHFISLNDGSFLNSVPKPDVGTIRANPVQLDGAVYFITTSGHLLKADPQLRAVTESLVGRYRP